MAETPFLQRKILQAAVRYLKHLKKNEDGRIVLSDFSEDALPEGVTPLMIRTLLFNLAQTDSLEEIFKNRAALISALEQREKPPPPTTTITPFKEVTVYPAGDEEKERVRVIGKEEVKRAIAELTKQVAQIKKAEKKSPKEKVVYEESPLTAVEEQVQKTIQTTEDKLLEELKTALEKDPRLKREIKNPEEVAHKASLALRERLNTLTTAKEARTQIQAVIEKETGLSRDPAYTIAGKVIEPGIRQTAIRRQNQNYIEFLRAHTAFAQAAKSALEQTLVSPLQRSRAREIFEGGAIDPILSIKDFARKRPQEAQRMIATTLRQAFSGDGLPPESIEPLSQALSSPEVSQALQTFARNTNQWEALPEEAQKIATQRAVPQGAEKAVFALEQFFVRSGLGDVPSKMEAFKAKQLATETVEKLIERYALIHRAREKGRRVFIPEKIFPPEEIPDLIPEAIVRTLDPKEYEPGFAQTVEEELPKIKEIPLSLTKKVEKVLEKPTPTLSEKEEAVAGVEEFIVQSLDRPSEKEKAQAKNLASKTIESLSQQKTQIENRRERKIPAALALTKELHPQELPAVLQEVILEALDPKKYGTGFVQKVEEGVQRITKLPPSVLREIDQTAEASVIPTKKEEIVPTVPNIKKLITQYGFITPPSKEAEAKIDEATVEVVQNLRARKTRIEEIIRRGRQARIPAEVLPPEELPYLIQETLAKIDREKYGSGFTEKVQTSVQERKFPPPLLESIQEALKTSLFQLPPAEKGKTIATIKQFLTREILLGKVSPREETSIEEIVQTALENLEREVRLAPSPIEKPSQLRQLILESLRLSLDKHEATNKSLVTKIRKGVTAAAAAEKLPPSVLRRLEEALRTLPPKLFPWEEEAITELEEKGILSPESAATYRKRIAQRKEEIEAFLSPITPPGIVSRISEKALASYLLSDKKTKEEKEELSERIRFLIEQAEELAPKNRISRNLLNRLFRLVTGEKSPLETAKTLAESGPSKLNFPARFRQEIFKRFTNALFKKIKWLKLDTYTGRLYSRFGGQTLKTGFSRLTSPVRTRLVQGLGRFSKTASQALARSGKLLNRALPALKGLATKLVGLLPKLATFIISLGTQAVTWLTTAIGGLVSAVGAPALVVIIIVALIIVLIVAIIILGVQVPGAFVDYSQTAGEGSCNLVDPLISSQLLIGTFQQSGGTFKVPPGVIAGVANIEGGHLWSYTDIEILTYSEEGEQDPYKTCQPNKCGARGPMQFLTGEGVDDLECPQVCVKRDPTSKECLAFLDKWSEYKEAVNEIPGENRSSPHVCNIKDSISAGAKMLKEKSQTAPENDCQWNKDQVYNAARGYYGKCDYAIESGGKIITGNYCEQVWQYYINSSVEPVTYP